jgi:hypothetical protein
VYEWQTSITKHIRTEKISPSSSSSTTSILHQIQSHINERMRFSIKEGRSWGLNNVFKISRIKGSRCNVKWNFSIVSFLSKVEFSHPPRLGYGSIYSLKIGTEGLSQSASHIWKFKDHGSGDVTWKANTIFNFENQTRCARAVVLQLVYTHVVWLVGFIYVEKYDFLALEVKKRDFKSA